MFNHVAQETAKNCRHTAVDGKSDETWGAISKDAYLFEGLGQVIPKIRISGVDAKAINRAPNTPARPVTRAIQTSLCMTETLNLVVSNWVMAGRISISTTRLTMLRVVRRNEACKEVSMRVHWGI